MWTLKPPGSDQEFVIKGPEVVVGRAAECAICIDSDKSISRLHARLQIVRSSSGVQLFVVDLGSKFHTYVDGDKIAPNSPVEIKQKEAKITLGGSGTTIQLIFKNIQICMTRVDKKEKEMVKLACQALHVPLTSSPSLCSHLVTPSFSATLKTLQAIALHKQLVSLNWIRDLHAVYTSSSGPANPLVPYPMEASYAPVTPADLPPLADRQRSRRGVFEGISVFVADKQDEEYSLLLKSCGAQIIKLYELLAAGSKQIDWAALRAAAAPRLCLFFDENQSTPPRKELVGVLARKLGGAAEVLWLTAGEVARAVLTLSPPKPAAEPPRVRLTQPTLDSQYLSQWNDVSVWEEEDVREVVAEPVVDLVDREHSSAAKGKKSAAAPPAATAAMEPPLKKARLLKDAVSSHVPSTSGGEVIDLSMPPPSPIPAPLVRQTPAAEPSAAPAESRGNRSKMSSRSGRPTPDASNVAVFEDLPPSPSAADAAPPSSSATVGKESSADTKARKRSAVASAWDNEEDDVPTTAASGSRNAVVKDAGHGEESRLKRARTLGEDDEWKDQQQPPQPPKQQEVGVTLASISNGNGEAVAGKKTQFPKRITKKDLSATAAPALTPTPAPTPTPSQIVAAGSSRQRLEVDDDAEGWVEVQIGVNNLHIRKQEDRAYKGTGSMVPDVESKISGRMKWEDDRVLGSGIPEEEGEQELGETVVEERPLISERAAESLVSGSGSMPSSLVSSAGTGIALIGVVRNVKRFVKNSVPGGGGPGTFRLNEMDRVLPRESERELQLRLEFEELQRGEQQARQLFDTTARITGVRAGTRR